MIPKKIRFTTRLFEKAFRRSRRIGSEECTFLVSDDPKGSHFSVVVGKKISKSAVRRNRLRRQMYEAMRTDLTPHLERKNVICLYKGPETMENTGKFRRSLAQLIQKLFPRKK